jgi:hypothetical protein
MLAIHKVDYSFFFSKESFRLVLRSESSTVLNPRWCVTLLSDSVSPQLSPYIPKRTAQKLLRRITEALCDEKFVDVDQELLDLALEGNADDERE